MSPIYCGKCGNERVRNGCKCCDLRDWKPIETAPKDGSDFLALIPWQTKHHQMVGCFAPDGRFRSWPGRMKYEPTYWQPLPPYPQE